MDSSRLEHLLKVIECGSITKASEELGYTQSGISHMVKALEKEFGFPLFARGRSGVEPTANGSSRPSGRSSAGMSNWASSQQTSGG